jgi:hypothetical protein
LIGASLTPPAKLSGLHFACTLGRRHYLVGSTDPLVWPRPL